MLEAAPRVFGWIGNAFAFGNDFSEHSALARFQVGCLCQPFLGAIDCAAACQRFNFDVGDRGGGKHLGLGELLARLGEKCRDTHGLVGRQLKRHRNRRLLPGPAAGSPPPLQFGP